MKPQNQQTNGTDKNNTVWESGIDLNKKQCDEDSNPCNCNELKTVLKIKVKGNSDDLTITCNGVNLAASIADLVDGYCRIVNNIDTSFWERIRLSMHKNGDSTDKNNQLSVADASRLADNPLHQSIGSEPNWSHGDPNNENRKFLSSNEHQ